MAKWLYSRWTSFIGFIFCLGLLSYAAYLQLHLGLLPCPLCVMQRIFIGCIGLVFLVGMLHTPSGRTTKRIHSGFIILFSFLGLLMAGRHVWLTLQPPSDLTTCSPTLDYMLQNLPLNQTLHSMFLGSGDCAKVTYHLFGLSIPQLTLIIFIAIFIFSVMRYKVAKSDRGL